MTFSSENKALSYKHVQTVPQIWPFLVRETFSQKGSKILPSAYFVELIQLQKLCVSINKSLTRGFGLFCNLSNNFRKLFDDILHFSWRDRAQKVH